MPNQKLKLKIFFLVILFFAIFGVAAKVSAATYYVKNGGNDSLSGLDDANAWATIAKVQATATSGDTVYFRSQDTWSGPNPLIIATPGVTYDGATYGSGTRATLQASSRASGYGIIHISDNDITFKGFKVDSNHLSLGGVYIGYVPTGSKDFSNVVVDGCEIVNGITADVPSPAYYYGIIIGSTGLHKTSNVQIINNIVHDVGHEGITVYPSWEFVEGGNSVETVLIRNNTVYETGQVTSNRGNGIDMANDADNVTIEFNTIYSIANTLVNGIVVATYNKTNYGDNLGSPDNLVIRYNLITGKGISLIPTSNGDSIGSAGVYGNIIINGSIHLGGDFKSSDTKIYNNTVYRDDALGEALFVNTVVAAVKPELKNNIFVTSNYYTVAKDNDGGSFTNITHENNLYYKIGSGSYYIYVNAATYTAAQILSTFEPTAQITTPTFTGGTLPTGFSGTYGTNLVPNTDYFKITSGNALNKGATLGSPYDGNINTAGTANPIVRLAGAYDIGAYEYQGADTTAPTAPSGLSVD